MMLPFYAQNTIRARRTENQENKRDDGVAERDRNAKPNDTKVKPLLRQSWHLKSGPLVRVVTYTENPRTYRT